MELSKQKRWWWVFGLLILASVSAYLIIQALSENINFYYTPAEIAQGKVPKGPYTRFGGLVKVGSIEKTQEPGHPPRVQFLLTDGQYDFKVRYEGVLPDLFKEGQGVVVMGYLDENSGIQAIELLAKHDENYYPPGIEKP